MLLSPEVAQLIQLVLLVALAGYQAIQKVIDHRFKKNSPNPGSGRCLSADDRASIRQILEYLKEFSRESTETKYLIRALARKMGVDL